MLHLESLELLGFKSFAEKTRVVFDKGTTVVIGPNGCGKSNLADAIGWALGVQGARSLRGQRMDDVIFGGTRKRKPSGFVEVVLNLSRSGEGPISVQGLELEGENFEIGRKLYRSGESIYRINQRRCRLRDIQGFLEQSGLGFASYALIAQGRMDYFLNANSLERRAIIESAASISGYKSRRRSAELKLEGARQNLLRVNDILTEVERQLRSLKRQAAKARRYRNLKEEFRQIQRVRFALEGREVSSKLELLRQELDGLVTTGDDLGRKLIACEEAYRQSKGSRDRIESVFSRQRERRLELRLELERIQDSIGYNQRQSESTENYRQNQIKEQQEIDQEVDKVNTDLDEFRAQRIVLEEDAERAESTMRDQQALAERYKAEVQAAETRTETLRAERLQLSAELANQENLQEQILQRLEVSEDRLKRLATEEVGHQKKRDASLAKLTAHRKATQSARAAIEQQRTQLEEAEAEKNELEHRLELLKFETVEAQNRVIKRQERLQSLQELELSHSQYSEGVRNFLRHLKKSGSIRVNGTLADFVEASPEFERLVEQFLNQELEYVLVDSLDEAVHGVSELKTLEGGRCTFLSLSANGFDRGHPRQQDLLRNEKGVLGTLSELLGMRPEIEQAFARALPNQAAALVVSDLESAFEVAHRHPDRTYITMQGEALNPGGLLSVSASASGSGGLLALKREAKGLEEKLTQDQAQLGALLKQEQSLAADLEKQTDSCLKLQGALHNLEKDIIRLVHEEGQWERDLRHYEEALVVVGEAKDTLLEERTQDSDKLAGIEESLTRKNSAQVEAERTLAEALESLGKLREALSEAQERLHLGSTEFRVLEARTRALGQTIERAELQRQGLETRKVNGAAVRTETEERLTFLAQESKELEAKLQTILEELGQIEESLEAQQKEYEKARKTCALAEERLTELREKRTELSESRSQVEVQQARFETQLQNLSEQCREQLQISLKEVIATTEDPDEESGSAAADVQSRYPELKDRLEEFGPVNMTALEEYQENEERYNFLTGQRSDIEKSIDDTTRAIQEINRRSREQFQAAFEKINLHFGEVFQKLFEGGECGMRLVDEEDVLESGIEVFAQPSGKKLQNVNLLSGGEKALTSIALLVALFMFRPSKFCVLDEVDAALDEANVARFTNLIRGMSDETQFILISHNKKTIGTAQTLYGVTMEEPGVSQVLSVSLEDQSAGDEASQSSITS